ncbi:TetR/AcrR family transcriptional regulator C-terminal domain-containing protein [Nesterenkonia lutea]|uniref:AcrR family transcriptional regulator n=1 Tax=Nesterenkonia lutea TaxID=272919 RepID=A0ABR9JHS9_9MICC|nr:TetR/AcrR family transcriptional regulator C-terminal domain-containing protein [Nesterenkonia lutea]MBE1525386.1 AcrR family transcriptional regulator [Nesterenkonia lutea]
MDASPSSDAGDEVAGETAEADHVFARPVKPGRVTTDLSQAAIVQACIKLLDEQGSNALTMRKVAGKLGVHATSLYWYVKRREDLIDLSLDEILRTAVERSATPGSWREEISETATQMHNALASHPWAPGFAATRPLLGPNALEIFRRIVTSLASTGAPAETQTQAAATISDFILGSATAAASAHAAGLDTPTSPLAQLVTRQAARAGSPLPGATHWEPSFDFGIDVLLDGLALRLEIA